MTEPGRWRGWLLVLVVGALLSVAITAIVALDAWAAERAGGLFAQDGSLRWRALASGVSQNALAGLAAASLLRFPHAWARWAILGLGSGVAGLLMAELRNDPAAWDHWVGTGGVLSAAAPFLALWLYAVAVLTLLGWIGRALLRRRGLPPTPA
jgi:hypothetical protein